MKDEIRPWYRWWWHKYRTSERVLGFSTLAVHGAYRNLLDAMWERGGALPTNRAILWKLALAGSREEYEGVAAEVESMFTVSEDGASYTNETLAAEWDNTSEFLDQKRLAGAASGRARRERKANDRLTTVERTANTPRTSSSSSSSSSTGSVCVEGAPEPSKFSPVLGTGWTPEVESQLFKIAKAHPKGDHFRRIEEVPPPVLEAIVNAILSEKQMQRLDDAQAYAAVLRKTLLYAQHVATWPKPDREKCANLQDFYLPSSPGRHKYTQDPESWQRSDIERTSAIPVTRTRNAASERLQQNLASTAQVFRDLDAEESNSRILGPAGSAD